jgi:hypothetical protein
MQRIQDPRPNEGTHHQRQENGRINQSQVFARLCLPGQYSYRKSNINSEIHPKTAAKQYRRQEQRKLLRDECDDQQGHRHQRRTRLHKWLEPLDTSRKPACQQRHDHQQGR